MEHLNREQLVSVLSHAKASRQRDWVLFLVSFWHGLRASEAINLTPDNFADGYLTVQRLKGSLRTVQPLVVDENDLLNERAAVDMWLAQHRAAHPGGGHNLPLFPISRIQFFRLMRRYGRLASLPQHLCHPHVLKHSIAMQSIREAGIENVRQYLGHRSISSTGAYLRVTDEAASLAVVKGTLAFRR
ncbi:MAG TPA: tyrosine-type recombinase/integrase [Candidatus Acidoferrales bacterium]